MSSILLLAFFLFAFQDDTKPDPPQKSKTIELEADIRKEDWYPESSNNRIQKIGNALQIVQRAQETEDNDRAWVMNQLAFTLADAAREPRVSHEIIQAMSSRWNVPPGFVANWHHAAINGVGNDARIPELAWYMLNDIKALSSEESIELWSEAFKVLQNLANKAESQYTRRGCAVPFVEIKAWLWITKAESANKIEADAFRSILSGDISDGIRKLTQSTDQRLANAALQVMKNAEEIDDAHQQLLSLLAESNSEAGKLSGQRIFESLLPKLTVEQITRWQPICYFMTESLPLRSDFSLPYHGTMRNGYHSLAQELKVPSGFKHDDESNSWSCTGKGSIEYPRLPYENYVAEVEMVIEAIGKEVKLAFGSEDSVQIRFYKDGDRIKARLIRRLGGRFNWKGSRRFAVGEKLVAKFYRTPERMFAFINGKKMNSRTFGLGWHKFRITVENGSKVVVSNIKTRPWLPGDREVLSKSSGQHKSIEMTALKFRDVPIEEFKDYFGAFRNLATKPSKNKPFVTPQEILMQPVAAADFTRSSDQRKVSLTNDFHISAHEITQKQFCEVMDYCPASSQGNAHFPVDNVTLAEANEFCKRLTKLQESDDLVPEGYEYRLPTEAEWTLAATSDENSKTGGSESEFWNWNSCEGGFRMVGTSTANERGIFDMFGNVEELTLSKHHKRKSSEETNDLPAIVDPVDVADGRSHIVVKGGSWNVGPDRARATRRDRRHQGRTPGRGFRIVLGPELK